MGAVTKPDLMAMILKAVDGRGFVGETDMEEISLRLRLPASRVYGFCHQFADIPHRQARARLMVCMGPSCMTEGAQDLFGSLKANAPADMDVTACPGEPRWHDPLAVRVVTERGIRVVDGITPGDIDMLLNIAEGGEDKGYRTPEEAMPPPVVEMGGSGDAYEAESGGKKEPGRWWDRDVLRKAAGSSGAAIREQLAKWVPSYTEAIKPAVVICDVLGIETEHSPDMAAALCFTEEVVGGAALAASACGAEELLFYLPWDDVGLIEHLGKTARAMLQETGLGFSLFRGPVDVAAPMVPGKAAVVRGMMLWEAASLASGDGAGTLRAVVVPADAARRLMRMCLSEKSSEETSLPGALVGVQVPGRPCSLMELKAGANVNDIAAWVGLEDGCKAVYLFGERNHVVEPARFSGQGVEGSRKVGFLDDSACMARMAMLMALYAGRRCCGGCAPGRTASSAVAGLIREILEGRGGDAAVASLERVLKLSGELALCEELARGLEPVRDCFRGFTSEFLSHANGRGCAHGSDFSKRTEIT